MNLTKREGSSVFLYLQNLANLTMAIPFFQHRPNWSSLVFRGIPIHLQILMFPLSFRSQLLVHLMHDLLVCPTLERYHLSKIVETEIEVQRDLHTSPTGVDSGRYNGRGVECGCLSDKTYQYPTLVAYWVAYIKILRLACLSALSHAAFWGTSSESS